LKQWWRTCLKQADIQNWSLPRLYPSDTRQWLLIRGTLPPGILNVHWPYSLFTVILPELIWRVTGVRIWIGEPVRLKVSPH
jgi:hypothetical protein